MERPDRRGPPHPDPGGHDDHRGALRQAPEGREGGVPRGRAQQHVLRVDVRLRQDGDALCGPGAQGAGGGRGPVRHAPGGRGGQGDRSHH